MRGPSIHLAPTLLMASALTVGNSLATAQDRDAAAGDPAPVNLIGDLTSRVVRHFDFNEPDNADPVPNFWVRIADAGFPDWNDAAFFPERSIGEGTDRCVRLPTLGGNTGMRLVAGVVPVIPRVDYHLRVRVKTEGLRRSRARVAVYFTDESGRRIPGTEASSPLIETSGQWFKTQVFLGGGGASVPVRDAEGTRLGPPAWLQVEFLVEQPATWDTDPTTHPRVLLEDVRDASAYFDDLTIWRVPRISLSSIEAHGLFMRPQSPVLYLRAQDVASAELATTIRTYNHRGEIVEETALRVTNDWQPALHRPNLPELGWYRSVAHVSESGQEIAQAWIDYAWLAPWSGGSPGVRDAGFGIVADDLLPDQWSSLPFILGSIGSDFVSLPLWPADLKRGSIRAHRAALNPTVAQLNRDARDLTFVLGALPDELAQQEHANASLVFETLGAPSDQPWRYLEDFLISFGQTVKRWQFGPTTEVGSGRVESRPERLDAIVNRLSLLVPSPQVALPWPVDRPDAAAFIAGHAQRLVASRRSLPSGEPERPDRQPLHFTVIVGNDITPDSLTDHLAPWKQAGLSTTIVLETADSALYGFEHQVDDLVRRAVLAREATDAPLAISRPWRGVDEAPGVVLPQPVLIAWRTLAEHLLGRTARARLDLGNHVTAIVFGDGEGEGTIALWHDSPENEVVRASIFLGNRAVTLTDPFGNSESVPLVDGAHDVRITRQPRFVDGAVINLALLRSGFRVTPRWIEGAAAVHSHEMVLRNPWKTGIAGTLRIIEPAEWDIRQRHRPFTIGGGEEIRLPLVFTYPAYEPGGPKRFIVDVELMNITTTAVRMESIVELGFRRIALTPHYEYALDSSGAEELVITLEIANNSDEPAWLAAMVLAEGYGRLELDVAQLAPGEVTVRVFRLPEPDKRLLNTMLRVGLRERGGPGRFNLLLNAVR